MPVPPEPPHNRYEDVLLCAPDGEQPVGVVRTLKWSETVLSAKTTDQGEIEEVLGFLVTVPPRNTLRIYSHVCREIQAHKAAGGEALPAVWNGAYTRCPLCHPAKKEA